MRDALLEIRRRTRREVGESYWRERVVAGLIGAKFPERPAVLADEVEDDGDES